MPPNRRADMRTMPRNWIRIGGASSVDQVDIDDGPAPRQTARYLCPRVHHFVVPLSADAEVPDTWTCPRHGVDAPRAGTTLAVDDKPARTHWDMLLERRSIPELEALLAERLALLDRVNLRVPDPG